MDSASYTKLYLTDNKAYQNHLDKVLKADATQIANGKKDYLPSDPMYAVYSHDEERLKERNPNLDAARKDILSFSDAKLKDLITPKKSDDYSDSIIYLDLKYIFYQLENDPTANKAQIAELKAILDDPEKRKIAIRAHHEFVISSPETMQAWRERLAKNNYLLDSVAQYAQISNLIDNNIYHTQRVFMALPDETIKSLIKDAPDQTILKDLNRNLSKAEQEAPENLKAQIREQVAQTRELLKDPAKKAQTIALCRETLLNNADAIKAWRTNLSENKFLIDQAIKKASTVTQSTPWPDGVVKPEDAASSAKKFILEGNDIVNPSDQGMESITDSELEKFYKYKLSVLKEQSTDPKVQAALDLQLQKLKDPEKYKPILDNFRKLLLEDPEPIKEWREKYKEAENKTKNEEAGKIASALSLSKKEEGVDYVGLGFAGLDGWASAAGAQKGANWLAQFWGYYHETAKGIRPNVGFGVLTSVFETGKGVWKINEGIQKNDPKIVREGSMDIGGGLGTVGGSLLAGAVATGPAGLIFATGAALGIGGYVLGREIGDLGEAAYELYKADQIEHSQDGIHFRLMYSYILKDPSKCEDLAKNCGVAFDQRPAFGNGTKISATTIDDALADPQRAPYVLGRIRAYIPEIQTELNKQREAELKRTAFGETGELGIEYKTLDFKIKSLDAALEKKADGTDEGDAYAARMRANRTMNQTILTMRQFEPDTFVFVQLKKSYGEYKKQNGGQAMDEQSYIKAMNDYLTQTSKNTFLTHYKQFQKEHPDAVTDMTPDDYLQYQKRFISEANVALCTQSGMVAGYEESEKVVQSLADKEYAQDKTKSRQGIADSYRQFILETIHPQLRDGTLNPSNITEDYIAHEYKKAHAPEKAGPGANATPTIEIKSGVAHSSYADQLERYCGDLAMALKLTFDEAGTGAIPCSTPDLKQKPLIANPQIKFIS